MKVLLDENIPHDLRTLLAHHDTFTVAYMGWGGLKNGRLLDTAEGAGFDVLITGDKTLEYEQNIYAVDSAQPGTIIHVECGAFNRRRPKPPALGPG